MDRLPLPVGDTNDERLVGADQEARPRHRAGPRQGPARRPQAARCRCRDEHRGVAFGARDEIRDHEGAVDGSRAGRFEDTPSSGPQGPRPGLLVGAIAPPSCFGSVSAVKARAGPVGMGGVAGAHGGRVVSIPVEDRIRRLAATVTSLRQGKSFSITKLTVIKTLCANPEDAQAFVLHVARLAREQLDEKHGYRVSKAELEKFKKPVVRAMAAVQRHVKSSQAADAVALHACFSELLSLQNQHRNVAWGTVRIIESMPALLVEKATRFLLDPEQGPRRAYEIARDYCERYDPSFGTGLIPASAPRLEELVEFLSRYHLRRSLRKVLDTKPT